jgi:hypothetical protein
VPAEDLPPNPPAWGLAIRYIAADAIANITYVLSFQGVILGGVSEADGWAKSVFSSRFVRCSRRC